MRCECLVCPHFKIVAEVHLAVSSDGQLVLVAVPEGQLHLVQQLVHVRELQYVLVHCLQGSNGYTVTISPPPPLLVLSGPPLTLTT